ncbi:hypothetical protein LBMAG42_32730 [Deltaproteobacteria bacterium]|nr:hypothetical protein LBMAG42_32730 [Deltaproteobacteria bacterium]
MTLTLLLSVALARPVSPELPANAPERRLTSTLTELWRSAASPASHEAFVATHPRFAGDTVQIVVELAPGTDTAAFAAGLRLSAEASFEDRIQLRVPASRLGAIAAHPSVRHVREPYRAQAKEEVEGEGYDATMPIDWHEDEEVTGAGVHVGVLDVGFSGADGLIGGELPSEVTFDLSRGAPESSKHGAAAAEVIADFAPDATFTLVSFSTDVEFGEGLQALLDADVDVVNASVGFDNIWAADGTSAPTRYADAMVEAGVIFVTAAGNERRRYRVGPLARVEDSTYIEIDGHYAIAMEAPNGRAHVSFRWSDPFGESATDLDLVVFDASTQRECGRSENPQDGDDDPLEEVDVSGCEENVYVAVYADLAVDPAGLTGYLYAHSGLDDAEQTGIESLSLPADCLNCLAVGAYLLEDQSIAGYSSLGPTNDGRTKPDFVGPTDVSTATMADAPFDGTSAATPHLAGLAALWVQATGLDSEPGEFETWAAEQAKDLGDPGMDNTSGHGAIQGGEIPPRACGCAGVAAGAPVATMSVLAAMLGVHRRRRG